jgi:hypothetical protein
MPKKSLFPTRGLTLQQLIEQWVGFNLTFIFNSANGSLGWVQQVNPTRRVTHWVNPGYNAFQFSVMCKNFTLLISGVARIF